MRFMMFMIPKVYQPDTPAGEGFAPPAESVARMMKFNEELAKAGANGAGGGFYQGIWGVRYLDAREFRFISPSRFGYLRIPHFVFVLLFSILSGCICLS